MFDRFVLASKYQRIRERYDMASLPEGEEYVPNCNIIAGNNTYVLVPETTYNQQTQDIPKALQSYFADRVPARAIKSFKWGLEGIEKQTKYFIRSEGDRNLKNDPLYTGSKAIFLNHIYKRLIRNNRCLVIADAFIVGIERNPYLVYLKHKQRSFGMAGLWSASTDEDGLKTYSFGILTVPANPLIKLLGYDRMPVIIPTNLERRWLRKEIELSQVLSMLNPYPHHLMNAYPISNNIRDVEKNNLSVIQPVGRRIYAEKVEIIPRRKVKEKRDIDNLPSWGETTQMGRSDKQ